ncbi:MAG: AI-2E family transporter [Anaerolineae bacterium]|nr:AI-2E family transporter [Anaerolineae bacterium]
MREALPRWFVYLMATVAVVWLFQQAWYAVSILYEVILLFFLAWLLGFILEPLIRRLAAGFGGWGGLPPTAAIVIVYLTLLVLLIIGLVVFIPAAAQQIALVVRQLPSWVAHIPDQTTEVEAALARLGLEVDIAPYIRRLDLMATLQSFGATVTAELFRLVTGVAGALTATLLTMVISFYMYLDSPRIRRRIERLAPPTWAEELTYLDAVVDRVFGGYLRSQLAMAGLTAVGTLLVMVVAQLPFALAVSLIAGLLMLIPYLGPLIAFSIPVIIGWQRSPFTALVLAIALLLVHQTISRIIMPRIVSYTTGLPAVLVLAGMLTGVRLAGLWGAIFGAPIVGILYTMVVYVYERRVLRRSPEETADAIENLPPY